MVSAIDLVDDFIADLQARLNPNPSSTKLKTKDRDDEHTAEPSEPKNVKGLVGFCCSSSAAVVAASPASSPSSSS